MINVINLVEVPDSCTVGEQLWANIHQFLINEMVYCDRIKQIIYVLTFHNEEKI
jgi:hypothetical protein